MDIKKNNYDPEGGKFQYWVGFKTDAADEDAFHSRSTSSSAKKKRWPYTPSSAHGSSSTLTVT